MSLTAIPWPLESRPGRFSQGGRKTGFGHLGDSLEKAHSFDGKANTALKNPGNNDFGNSLAHPQVALNYSLPCNLLKK
jgi:hypothetical protein